MSPTQSRPPGQLSTEYQAYKIYLLFSRYQKSRKGKLRSPCAVTGRKKCCWGCSAHRSFSEGNWRTARRNYCLHVHLSHVLTTTQGVPSIIPALIWGFLQHVSKKERNRCQQLPGKPIELVCDNSWLSIALLTGILNFLCLCENRKTSSGRKDASNRSQQKGLRFQLS